MSTKQVKLISFTVMCRTETKTDIFLNNIIIQHNPIDVCMRRERIATVQDLKEKPKDFGDWFRIKPPKPEKKPDLVAALQEELKVTDSVVRDLLKRVAVLEYPSGNLESLRQAFEVYARSKKYCLTRNGFGTYISNEVHREWLVWQAARGV